MCETPKHMKNGLTKNKMTKKIIQIAIAVMIATMFYRLYRIEQRIERLDKLELKCSKPE